MVWRCCSNTYTAPSKERTLAKSKTRQKLVQRDKEKGTACSHYLQIHSLFTGCVVLSIYIKRDQIDSQLFMLPISTEWYPWGLKVHVESLHKSLQFVKMIHIASLANLKKKNPETLLYIWTLTVNGNHRNANVPDLFSLYQVVNTSCQPVQSVFTSSKGARICHDYV